MRRRLAFALGVLALSVPTPVAHAVPAVPTPAHVVVVVEENKSGTDVIGNKSAPYLNWLAANGALMTASFAVTHPSQPNYLALFAGDTLGVTSDDCPVDAGAAPNQQAIPAVDYLMKEVGVKRWVPLQDVHELVLLGVRMPKRRHCARSKPRQVHPEVGETEQITQRLLSSSRHLRRERLGVVRCLGSQWRFMCDDGNRVGRICHMILVHNMPCGVCRAPAPGLASLARREVL